MAITNRFNRFGDVLPDGSVQEPVDPSYHYLYVHQEKDNKQLAEDSEPGYRHTMTAETPTNQTIP